MTRSPQMFVFFVMFVTQLLAATGQSVSSVDTGFQAVFTASNGDVIELNTHTGSLVTPRSRNTRLQDCSDGFQVCLTDHHGFAFAYFRNCNDAGYGDYKRLKFRPRIISVLHNNVWMVYDASPNYLFHYIDSKGLVGIYVGPTASFDFRSVLRDRNFHLDSLDAMEYRITSPNTIAACNAGLGASAPSPMQQKVPATDTLLHESGHVDPPKQP